MVCLCKTQLATLTAPAFTASLSAALQIPLPPLPKLPLSLMLSASTAPSAALMASIGALSIPKISLLLALPQLGAIAAAAVTCNMHLGLPLPGALPKLSLMLGNFNPAMLSPLMSLPLGPLLALSAYAALALKLRLMFNLNPWEANLAGPLTESLALSMAPGGALYLALNVPMPTLPALTLGTLHQLASLLTIALSLGVNLAAPGGIASLALALGPLATIALPPLRIPLPLLARINALATINAAFGLGPAMASLPLMIASLTALISLKLPFPSIKVQLGLPTTAALSSILALNLPQLAAISWSVPAMPSLMAALPALSLVAKLNGLLPMINLTPCASFCPLAAL